jgi:hypothetical protein
MDSTDTLSEFTVNFQYQYLKVDNTKADVATGTSAASVKAAQSLGNVA